MSVAPVDCSPYLTADTVTTGTARYRQVQLGFLTCTTSDRAVYDNQLPHLAIGFR